MKTLFVAWQDEKSRQWAPVGRLTHEEDGLYQFAYTRGAKDPRFVPFGAMRELKSIYKSETLFPIFSNRVLAKNRPEYSEYLRWLNLTEDKYDVLEELARTGGLRATDSLELFPCPEPTKEKNYEVYFFCRGFRHLHEENQKRACQLKSGERLYLMRDLQNPSDPKAWLMRTDDPITLVGYVPRYYSSEFTALINSFYLEPKNVNVMIERVNLEAPAQYRVLCKLISPWPENFSPCSADEFQPIS
jgi:hypothetical protein